MASDQATDNANAPAGDQTGTTGTAAPADELSTKYASLEKQHAELRTKFNQRDQEISQLRRTVSQTQQQQQGGYSEEVATGSDGLSEMRSRQEVIEFKLDHPDWASKWDKVQEVASDPSFARIYANHPDSRGALEAAYNEAIRRELVAENTSLRATAAKLSEAKEAARNQAFVSGQGAAMQPENIDEQALQKMTRKEMEDKYGKENLLRGLF